jgi:hypothetical protein
MGRPRKDIPHQLPESILINLNEHTSSFVLFTINKEGNLEIFNQFDNQAYQVALSNHIRHWAESLEVLNSNGMFHSIAGDEMDEENEEGFVPPPDEED